MNRRQRAVILMGLGVVALMLIVPPWVAHKTISRPARNNFDVPTLDYVDTSGYAPLFAPPEGQRRLDATRLGLQIAAAAVLTAGAYVMLGGKEAGK